MCLLREGLWYEILVPYRRKTLVLEVYAFHEKGFYKRGGEEYGQPNSGISEWESMRVEFRRVVVFYVMV